MNKDKSKELDDILSELNQNIGDKKQNTVDEKADESDEQEVIGTEVTASVGEIIPENGEVIPKRNIPLKKKKVSHYTKKQKVTAILGMIIVIFTVIGVVSSVIFAWGKTSDLINNTAEKEELARVVFPLVIVDTPEFSNPSSLDNSVIVSTAVWALVTDKNANLSQYPADNLGTMTVPQVDIEKYVHKLFGSGVKITHSSIDTSSLQILYSADEKAYQIESTPKYITYTPRVDTISKSGNEYTLKVNYILPDITWTISKDYKETVSKIMEYKLIKNEKGEYTIKSVKFLELPSDTSQTSSISSGTSSNSADDPFASESASSDQQSTGSKAESGSTSAESVADDEGV